MSGKPFVPVLGSDGKPLMPCTGKRARLLLQRGRAKVVRMEPFVIQLLDRNQDDCELQPIQLKIDPGSRYTGMAIARETEIVGEIQAIRLIELEHRGKIISMKLRQRATYRRNRRYRKTRYRKPRFLNRTKPKGWLPPSLNHRIDTTMSWVNKLRKIYPITSLHVEIVKFDTQKLRNPDIFGTEYQKGELFKYDVKEYLLEKWNRKCAYCDTDKVTRFEIDHIIPRSRGGVDSLSNLVLSCVKCNRDKGSKYIEEFLENNQKKLKYILSEVRKPLNDAAAMNSTRSKLLSVLISTELPTYSYTGSLTKYNRVKLNLDKTHSLDALCVGNINSIKFPIRKVLLIRCDGRGVYQRTITDKYGFPRLQRPRIKYAFGFRTGDLVKVASSNSPVFNKEKFRGFYFGRVAIRHSGRFDVKTSGKIIGAVYHKCKLVQKYDGYGYSYRKPSEFPSYFRN